MSFFGFHICMDEINALIAVVTGLKCFAHWQKYRGFGRKHSYAKGR